VATINGSRRNDQSIGPGDVVILSVTPWRANDDIFADASSVKAGEDNDLGTQLVVEVSIFNYNAELPPAIGGKGNSLAICHERDLKPLSNVALKIHKQLAQSDFVNLVVEEMKNDEALGEIQMSPFYSTFEQMKLAQEGHVVTSWTIKTDIGTEYSTVGVGAFGGLLSLGFVLLLVLFCSITAYLCHRRYSVKRPTSESVGQSPRVRRQGNFTGAKSNRVRWANDDHTINASVDDNYLDERTAMTDDGSEYTRASSYRSVGSLSTYLQKMSRRSRE
jgi:hypothetical protein